MISNLPFSCLCRSMMMLCFLPQTTIYTVTWKKEKKSTSSQNYLMYFTAQKQNRIICIFTNRNGLFYSNFRWEYLRSSQYFHHYNILSLKNVLDSLVYSNYNMLLYEYSISKMGLFLMFFVISLIIDPMCGQILPSSVFVFLQIFKWINHPKMRICWKCAHPQNVDGFDSSTEQIWRNVAFHHLLTNRSIRMTNESKHW